MSSDKVHIKILYTSGKREGYRTINNTRLSGVAHAFHRSLFREICNDPEKVKSDSPCVYALWNLGDNEPGVYVGRTGNLARRMGEHDRNRQFWNQAVVYATEPGDLTMAHMSYIEARLYQLAMQSAQMGLCVVKNEKEPDGEPLSEGDKFDAERHLDDLCQFVFPIAECDFFRPEHRRFTLPKEPLIQNAEKKPVAQATKESAQEKPLATDSQQYEDLTIITKDGWKATGREKAVGFAVHEGSHAAKDVSKAFAEGKGAKHYPLLREDLKKAGVLVEDGNLVNLYRFAREYTFSSASTAASMVRGYPANGRTEWKNKDGDTLGELQAMSHGTKMLEAATQTDTDLPLQEGVLYLVDSGLKASCRKTKDGFIVHAGSQASKEAMHSRESFVPEANLDMSRWVLRFFGCFSDQTTYRADANSLALRTEPLPVQREAAC